MKTIKGPGIFLAQFIGAQAPSASIVVRITLLYGSCSVRLQPEVWQWVRRAKDFGLVAPKPLTASLHR